MLYRINNETATTIDTKFGIAKPNCLRCSLLGEKGGSIYILSNKGVYGLNS